MELYMDYITIAMKIAVIVLGGILVYYLLKRAMNLLQEQEYFPGTFFMLLRGIVRWGIVATVILLSLQQAGVAVTSIWAALSALVVMVAIGFVAVWSVLSNILCSALLLIFAPFRIGDEIEVIEATGGKGLRGRVTHLNILYTSLEEISAGAEEKTIIQIPNNMFFQKSIRRKLGTKTQSLAEAFSKKAAADEGDRD